MDLTIRFVWEVVDIPFAKEVVDLTIRFVWEVFRMWLLVGGFGNVVVGRRRVLECGCRLGGLNGTFEIFGRQALFSLSARSISRVLIGKIFRGQNFLDVQTIVLLERSPCYM